MIRFAPRHYYRTLRRTAHFTRQQAAWDTLRLIGKDVRVATGKPRTPRMSRERRRR